MNCDPSNLIIPAPCIVDTGILINKQDIRRLLSDLGLVRYVYLQDGKCYQEGEGYIVEVFAERERSTIIANHSLYLNVYSFDYLEMKVSEARESYFDLIQENRQLRLIPLSNILQEKQARNFPDSLNAAALTETLEAVLTEVLSAKLDAELDDDGNLPF